MEMLLIVAAVAVIGSYVAQRIIVQNLAKTKGVNLATGRFIPVLAFLGVLFTGGLLLMSGQYGGFTSALTSSGTIGVVIMLGSIAVFAYLLIRNIRGAGAGMGILLTVLQVISGLLILALGVASVAAGAAMGQMTGGSPGVAALGKQQRASKKRAAEVAAAEHEQDAALAEHYGFTSTRDAAEAGVIPGTEENLKEK